jgi:prevent-host-death family protein
MPAAVSATYVKNHFGEILRRVDADKESIIIKRNGTPVAVLAPIAGAERRALRNQELLALAGSARIDEDEAQAWTDEVRAHRTSSRRWKEAQR